LTYTKAKEQGIATAQLPIGKFLQMDSRKVLTVNQMIDILLNYGQTSSWEVAFRAVIPKRKKAQLKETEEKQDEEHKEGDVADENVRSEGL
jgi:tRNA (guanine9-N1)-methyltransferase